MLALLLGLPISFTAAATQQQREYQQQLAALAESIKTLQSELKATQNSKERLQQSLQDTEKESAALSKKISRIKEALAREKKQLSRLQTQRTELDRQRQHQHQHILRVIHQAYRMGNHGQLKLLLNQEEPEKISRLLTYHGYVVRFHQEKIKAHMQTLNEINQVTERINLSHQQWNKQRRQLSQHQQKLKITQKQRSANLKALTDALRDKGQQLATLTQDRKRLQQLLDEANKALGRFAFSGNAQPFSQLRGKLPRPTTGNIIHRFGSLQFDGKLGLNGILIAGQSGTKVVSVHHGRVIFSDYLRGYGLLLIIDHGNHYMSLYGHNQTLLKSTGDEVSTGESVATVGNSGGQQQAGLYFEIRHKGRPKNPQLWLRQQS